MDFHEREFFISRICAGYLRYQAKPDVNLILKYPSNDIKYQAQEEYQRAYDSAMDDNVYTDKDLVNFLKDFNVWNDKLEEYLTDDKIGLPHQIETFKIQLFQAAFKPSEQKKIRLYLNTAKKEIMRLTQIRHQYDYITCHGLATYARWTYIVQNCTYFEDGNPYDWGDTSAQQVMTYYQSQMIPETKIRYIAHTEPWNSRWCAMKLNGNAFGSDASSMTEEQVHLLSWTGLYNNIGESPDCPPKSVIDDDDMLDGWMLLENQNREKEQSKKRNDDIISNNAKIANSDEIFIMAETKEDAQSINQLNTAQSAMIKNMRLKQVAKESTVSHKDFNDVKMDQAMKANQAYIQKMKER